MKRLDSELERGLEALLRPLLEPPTVYVVAAAILGALVYVGERQTILRAIRFVDSHRVLVGLLAALLAVVAAAVLVAVRRLWRHWRRREPAADLVSDWPELAEGLQLSGSVVLGVQRDHGGQTVRLQLNRFRGQTSSDLVTKLPRLESALRVRPGAVRVLPNAERADHCTLRVVERDPLAKPIPWTPPAVSSITEAIVLGVFEDHQPVELRLWEKDRQRHVLIAGVNGSGKSGLINVALGSLARCQDLVLWGIDLKGGMEFAAWQSVLDRLATSPAEAARLLEAANRGLDTRMELLASRRWRRWRPSASEPLLLIVVDEVSELPEEGLTLLKRIARLGRAPGVQLVVATQRPSAKQLESPDDSGMALRGQLQTRVCMRVTETREADMVLGGGLGREGWRADRLLREPGTFLILDAPEHVQPVPGRCFLMSDSAVAAAVDACKGLRPQLDAITTAAVVGRDAKPEPPDQQADPSVPHEARQLDPEAALLAALAEAGAEGLALDELITLGLGQRTWIYERLKRLVDRGAVKRLGGRRWACV
jgi:S-DNA-T family DNA segregation ATPase FtsK/SpoIIIE